MLSGDGKGTGSIWRPRFDLGQAIPIGLSPGGLLLDELVAFKGLVIKGPTFKTLFI